MAAVHFQRVAEQTMDVGSSSDFEDRIRRIRAILEEINLQELPPAVCEKFVAIQRIASGVDRGVNLPPDPSRILSLEIWANAKNNSDISVYPKEIQDFLKGDCTIWPGKKRGETHRVIPLFSHVERGGEVVTLTLRILGQLNEDSGGIGYREFHRKISQEISSTRTGRYLVVTKDVLPQTRGERYDRQIHLLPEGYKPLRVFDAVMAIFWEMQCWGQSCFMMKPHPGTYTYCEEVTPEGYHFVVGGITREQGLFVSHNFHNVDKGIGLAACLEIAVADLA